MRAGFGFTGNPGTASPAAQRMPAWMSESKPPHLPSTRTGRIFTPKAVPAMPWPLLAAAPMIPAILVPCQELLAAPQS